MTRLDKNLSTNPTPHAPQNSERLAEASETPLDDFYADPEVLRRIGVLIATAARRSISAKY